MCTCVGYRNPVYLAKVASTCDTVSAGRVEMGIGAGWYEHEWRAYGYGFPRAGERIAMLDEAVQIMRQAWTTGVATLDGTHYQVDGAIVRPLPVQDGGIPIWIAGGGEQKTLRIVARYADYANFDATPDVFRRKSEVLAEHCREIGRDFDEITRSGDYNVVIGRDEREVQERLDWIVAHYEPLVPADQLERYRTMFRTGPLVGTPELIVERLHEAAKMGLSYAIANFADAAYDPSSMELFASEVIPELADI
jgi:alkanesulfonate monooxygenase SsuD/methylene tetrahydromethanopterin reductase-like flavin-dependent oxidoreductase (luciferase family)